MIIDSHCHAGRGQRLDSPWSTNAPLHLYLRRARAAGIDRTVLLSTQHNDYAQANAQVARIVALAPQRLIGFAVVHAQRDAGRIRQMVERSVTQWKFRGIKVHCYEAPATREVAETARAFHLPVLYDIVGEAWRIEPIAAEYPDVAFILPHLGSFADDWRTHTQVIDQITRIPNVFADTSGVKRFDYVAEAVQRAGAHKVLFGSDGPWLHPVLELQKIRLLYLPPEQEALVLGGNLMRLISRGMNSSTRPHTELSRQRTIP
jgi:predicted TIM-barrel fold metal-dependent hydrolase